jgi:hypothetical protein
VLPNVSSALLGKISSDIGGIHLFGIKPVTRQRAFGKFFGSLGKKTFTAEATENSEKTGIQF